MKFKKLQAGNVIFRKEATKGNEHLPGICIQAHMDMVCSKNSDSTHNFLTDPIVPVIDGEFLKASGTTLGADDGIGVAACLALLEDNSLDHPLLECLITTNEETDMSGAENLPNDVLLSKILINVDSEEEDSICIGCAGGLERALRLKVKKEQPKESSSFFKVSLIGLLGGHSGAQIHEGLGNAIQLLARIMNPIAQEHQDIQLASFYGGTAINTIPRECFSIFGLPKAQVEEIKTKVLSSFDDIKKEYKLIEPNMQLLIENESSPQECCNHDSTKKILDFLSIIHHGVFRMSPSVPGLVETSNSLSIVSLEKEYFEAQLFARSSSNSQMKYVSEYFDALSRSYEIEIIGDRNGFPGKRLFIYFI